MRMEALLLRELLSNSSSLAFLGTFISFISALWPQTHTGNDLSHMQSAAIRAKVRLTVLSSSEWNVITHILPPFFKRRVSVSTASPSPSSSPLTSILMA